MIIQSNSPPAAIEGETARIAAEMPPEVKSEVSRLGRTEDVRFSPDNRKMAVAGYANDTCCIFDVDIDLTSARPAINITDWIELHSDALIEPHGFDFADNNLLVVANRGGQVTLFAIPEKGTTGKRTYQVDPLRTIRHAYLARPIHSPGSICVSRASDRHAEILVCNNYRHRITRHRFPLRSGFAIPRNAVVLDRGLDIPDGIAISADRAWVAISNHSTSSVLVFDHRAGLRRSSAPVGTLGGVACPHGLRFLPDGKHICVADAGAPLVHFYASGPHGWRGSHSPVFSVRVLDDETFMRGRHNPEEGGPKGIDLNAGGDIMAVTCEERALAFFHVPALFAAHGLAG